jgi:hypothetical protein
MFIVVEVLVFGQRTSPRHDECSCDPSAKKGPSEFARFLAGARIPPHAMVGTDSHEIYGETPLLWFDMI